MCLEKLAHKQVKKLQNSLKKLISYKLRKIIYWIQNV